MPNRLANETSPYLLQHKDNPVDWYAWGEEAFADAKASGQAGAALGRLLGLPLVPRHGARELREPGDRGADEPAVREHQGRPRRAPRHRQHLYAGGAVADRPRRLADDRLPHAGRRALLRRHLLPARGPPGHARLPATAHRRLRGLSGQAPAARNLRPRTADPDRLAGPTAGRRQPADGVDPARRRGRHPGPPRRRLRRLRPRAQVPPGDDARLPPALPPLIEEGAPARGGRDHPQGDGPRRHVRPGRRRLPPLLHG